VSNGTVLRFCGVVVAGAWLGACGPDAGTEASSGSAKARSSGSARSSAATTASAASTATAAATATATAAPKDEGTAITKHYPAVGDKGTTAETQVAEMKVDIKGPKGEFKEEATEAEQTEKAEECLAVTDKSCSKMKVTYTKAEKKVTTKDGKTKDSKVAHAGKTYVLELKDGAVAVTTEDGKEPPKEELAAVKKDYKSFGKDGEILDAIPEKVKVGDSLDKLAQALASRAMDSENKPSKMDAKVTVKEFKTVDGKTIIVLDISMDAEGEEDNGGAIKVSMKGTIDLRADIGLPLKREMKGPVSVVFGEKAKGGVTGKAEGQMSLTSANTYSF
jgi:hypothetical protein